MLLTSLLLLYCLEVSAAKSAPNPPEARIIGPNSFTDVPAFLYSQPATVLELVSIVHL